jgi:hypothetical protein
MIGTGLGSKVGPKSLDTIVRELKPCSRGFRNWGSTTWDFDMQN